MKPSEQRLLALFTGTLVLGGSWVAWSSIREQRVMMREEREALASQIELDQRFIDAYRPELEQADAWLKRRVGDPISSQEALSSLLKEAQQSATSSGLALRDPNFRAPEQRGRYELAKVAGTVTGSELAIYQWLADFHNPDKLRSIHSLTIRPDRDDATIITCEVEFAKWYLSSDESEEISGS